LGRIEVDFSGLSDIEMVIALKLSEGLMDKEIAACVGLSVTAAKQRITTIIRKTGARNKIDLAVGFLKARRGTE
jgi:DNA-binding NarL/FixJ family response regulator